MTANDEDPKVSKQVEDRYNASKDGVVRSDEDDKPLKAKVLELNNSV